MKISSATGGCIHLTQIDESAICPEIDLRYDGKDNCHTTLKVSHANVAGFDYCGYWRGCSLLKVIFWHYVYCLAPRKYLHRDAEIGVITVGIAPLSKRSLGWRGRCFPL